MFKCNTSTMYNDELRVSIRFSSREGASFVVSHGIRTLELSMCGGLIFTCFYSVNSCDSTYGRLSRAQATQYVTICFDPTTKLFYTLLLNGTEVVQPQYPPKQPTLGAQIISNVLLYLSYLNIPKKSTEYSPRRLSKRDCLLYNFRKFVTRYQHLLSPTTVSTHTDYLRSARLYAVGGRIKHKNNFKAVDEDVWDRLPLKRLKTKPSPSPSQIFRFLKSIQDLLSLLNAVLDLHADQAQPCFLCSCSRAGFSSTANPTPEALRACSFVNSFIYLAKRVLGAANISSRTAGVAGSTQYRKLLPSPLVYARAVYVVSTLLDSRKVRIPLDFETISNSIAWRRYLYHPRPSRPRNRRLCEFKSQQVTNFSLFSQFFTLLSSFLCFVRIGFLCHMQDPQRKPPAAGGPLYNALSDNFSLPASFGSEFGRERLLLNAAYAAVLKTCRSSKYNTNTEAFLRLHRGRPFYNNNLHLKKGALALRRPHVRLKRCFLFYKQKKKLLGPFLKKMLVL